MQNDSNFSRDWLLIANGAPVSRAKLRTLANNKSIMVLDGAYEYVKHCDLQIDILLGDFDSINPAVLAQVKTTSVQVVHAPDQNKTDLEKGILYLDQLSARSIVIAAATGQRLQHTLYNLRILKKFHEVTRPLQLVTEDEYINYVENDELPISGKINDSIGILGFPEARITSMGLKYEVEDYPLQFELAASVANALMQEQASVKVQGGALIIRETS